MDLSALNPHIRYAKLHYPHVLTRKEDCICYDCRFYYIENANGTVLINGDKYNISNEMVIYLPPLTRYRFNMSGGDDFKFIIINFDLISDFSHIKDSLGTATDATFNGEKVLRYPLPKSLSQPILRVLPQVRTSLTQCTENFLVQGPFFRERSSALLKLCLLELLRKDAKKSTHSELCENVMSYMHENHMNQTLSNDVIAEHFGYHSYHLNHIIKNETGKSLHRHLLDIRLNIAKNYLLTTSLTIEQISWKTGFSSTSHFIKTFKDSVGMTPKKYRQVRSLTEI